jgi:quercetin dioxygenase-like cupin family protein
MKTLCLSSLLILFIFLQGKAQYNSGISIVPVLKTDTTSIGQKIKYPSFPDPEVTMLKIIIPPGKTTGWHEHQFPVFAYVIKGVLTVEFAGNKFREFGENSSFSEVLNTPHQGINKGPEDLVLLAIYMGEKGKPLSEKKEKP